MAFCNIVNNLYINRILDELSHLRQELEGHKEEIEHFYQQQLRSVHTTQNSDIQNIIRQGMERNAEFCSAKAKEACQQQSQQIMSFSKSQHERLEDFMEEKFKEHSNPSRKQVNNSQSFVPANNQRFQFHESIPQQLRDQLNEMHRKHQEEIVRIRSELAKRHEEPQRTSKNWTDAASNFAMPNKHESLESPRYIPPLSKRSSIVSPLNWSSKNFFNKNLDPSPVAKVLPQRHNTSSNISNRGIDMFTNRTPGVRLSATRNKENSLFPVRGMTEQDQKYLKPTNQGERTQDQQDINVITCILLWI